MYLVRFSLIRYVESCNYGSLRQQSIIEREGGFMANIAAAAIPYGR
jgi:hypothetical protein